MNDEKKITGDKTQNDEVSQPDDLKTEPQAVNNEEEKTVTEENTADEGAVAKEDSTKESEQTSQDDTEEQSPEETTDEAVEEAVDEYAIEDEPFVRRATPEEIAYYSQRITGEEHSLVTTAAPVRTRKPSENRNVTNGIPQRGAQPPRTSHPIHREPQQKKKSGVFPMVITAALLVAAMLTSVVIGVNLAYAEKEDTRPSDFDMIDRDYEDAVNVDALSTRPAETDKPETADPAESTADTEETDPVEPDTTPPETTPPETEPETETDPPETEPPSPQYTVKLDFFDRDDIVVSTEQTTLRQLLTLLNVTLQESDRANMGLDDTIATDTTVKIDQVLYRTETVTEAIAYTSQVIEIDTIPRGDTNYLQYGKEGSKNIYYTIETVNGVETNRTRDWEEIKENPVEEIYELGVGGEFVGNDGVTYTYSYRRVVPATYYNLTGLTFLGTEADETVIAVDRTKIPLGTQVYVKNDTFDFGLRTAADVGPKVNEWQIDIWIGPDNPQLEEFARIGYHHDMEIYYVD